MHNILPLLLQCTCAHTERQKDVTSRAHNLASEKMMWQVLIEFIDNLKQVKKEVQVSQVGITTCLLV